jgi:hypothetical protein
MAGRIFLTKMLRACASREKASGEHDGQMGFDAVAEARSTTVSRD